MRSLFWQNVTRKSAQCQPVNEFQFRASPWNDPSTLLLLKEQRESNGTGDVIAGNLKIGVCGLFAIPPDLKLTLPGWLGKFAQICAARAIYEFPLRLNSRGAIVS